MAEMTEAEKIKRRIEIWRKFREEEERMAEERHNDSLYKQWGIKRVDLGKNSKDNDWSEEELAQLGHS